MRVGLRPYGAIGRFRRFWRTWARRRRHRNPAVGRPGDPKAASLAERNATRPSKRPPETVKGANAGGFAMGFTPSQNPFWLKRNRLLQNVRTGSFSSAEGTACRAGGMRRRSPRWTQGRGLGRPPRAPVPKGEQPLDVLAGGDQERLGVHLLQPPEPESSQAVEVLGLGEQGLDPHPPLAQGLLVGEGPTVGPDPLDVGLIEVAEHLAARLVLRASGSQLARFARAGVRFVDSQAPGLVLCARE